jgi:hypothetical protein
MRNSFFFFLSFVVLVVCPLTLKRFFAKVELASLKIEGSYSGLGPRHYSVKAGFFALRESSAGPVRVRFCSLTCQDYTDSLRDKGYSLMYVNVCQAYLKTFFKENGFKNGFY